MIRDGQRPPRLAQQGPDAVAGPRGQRQEEQTPQLADGPDPQAAAATTPEGVSYMLPPGEPMLIEDIRDSLVIRERSVFLLTDSDGNVPAGNEQGLGIYHADTRHLSTYSFSLNGVEPVLLLSTAEMGYAMEQVLTNPTLVAPGQPTVRRGSIELRRQRTVADLVEERLKITNFDTNPLTLNVRYDFGADFADIFDVRGYQRSRHGTRHEPAIGARSITYAYTGIDDRERQTEIVFDRMPDRLDAGSALFRVTLAPREHTTIRTAILVDGHKADVVGINRFRSVAAAHREWRDASTQIVTDNEFFNRVLDRCSTDIRMLMSRTEQGHPYPAAGTPWFDALFGRDSCIVSMQALAYQPEVARSTLRLLSRYQGTRLDPAHDEEPGKILHEMRLDELSRANELPYGPYFGSVDSTPLFLMLIAEYYAWTGDIRLVRELLPAIKQAFHWLDVYGDPLDTGYLSYEKRSARGLVNQGWKDSWDAVVHEDGELATAPITLAEVQGYAYAARVRLAPLLERLGERELANKALAAAARLRQQFNEAFWAPERRYYAMALDGKGRQVRSISTNPAHCLWAGLADPSRAQDIAGRLMSEDMFTGWGIRTLERGNPRFNPIGYHVGSVWPHDNSIAAMGLKMYGFEDHVNAIATALFDTSVAFPYFRLPELFGGDARSEHRSPVPYPVACRPQSWAAGAMLLVTQAMLGLKAETAEHRLRIVNPRLPNWLQSVHVRGLRVGQGAVTLQFRRSGRSTNVEVQKTTGGIDVIVSKRWPLETEK
jgi:glycogen debranching enzyme